MRRPSISRDRFHQVPRSRWTLYGRFCGIPSPPNRWTHHDPRRPEIRSGGFAANMGRSLDTPQLPPQPSQRDDLLFLFFAQDIARVTERNSPPVKCPDQAILLADFQVSTYGRFWVSERAVITFGEPQAHSHSLDSQFRAWRDVVPVRGLRLLPP